MGGWRQSLGDASSSQWWPRIASNLWKWQGRESPFQKEVALMTPGFWTSACRAVTGCYLKPLDLWCFIKVTLRTNNTSPVPSSLALDGSGLPDQRGAAGMTTWGFHLALSWSALCGGSWWLCLRTQRQPSGQALGWGATASANRQHRVTGSEVEPHQEQISQPRMSLQTITAPDSTLTESSQDSLSQTIWLSWLQILNPQELCELTSICFLSGSFWRLTFTQWNKMNSHLEGFSFPFCTATPEADYREYALFNHWGLAVCFGLCKFYPLKDFSRLM